MMGQEMKTPKKKASKIPLHIYLGYLIILTLVFTTASFAKFATSGDSMDSAKVASFSVSAAVGDNSSQSVGFNDAASSFTTSQTVTYDINVTNSEDKKISEVAVGYSIIISYDSTVITPDALTFSIDGTTLSPSGGNGKYTYTYVSANPLPAGVQTEVTHKLSVTVISDKIVEDYEDIPLSVSVAFEQIN